VATRAVIGSGEYRGFPRDTAPALDGVTVEAMVSRGMVAPARLWELFEAIRPELLRYPAIDAESFADAVRAFVDSHSSG
jgi:hypothetical protein